MKSVSQNTFFYLSGSVVQKILVFFYFIGLARFLGPELVGKYTFALSFVGIFVVLMDMGLNQFLIREVAKDKERAKSFLSYILGIKLVFSFFTLFVVVLAIRLLGYPEITRYLVYLVAIAYVIDNIINTIYCFLRGFQNLKYEGLGLVLYQFVVLIVGLAILYLRLPLPYMAWPLIVASFCNLFFVCFILYKVYLIKLVFKFDFKRFGYFLKSGVPFFLVAVFGTIFSYIDIVLLSKLAGDKAVGFYSAGGKIPAGLRMLPIALSAALYPTASFYFKERKEELSRLVEKALFYLIIFATPIMVGLWILAEPAIRILYGSCFVGAVPVLRILISGLIFVFLDYIFIVTLNACDKEKKNLVNRCLAMITIIILNLIFIPRLKEIGSAIAFILSFIFLTTLGAIMAWREIKFSWQNIIVNFLKVLLASFLMF